MSFHFHSAQNVFLITSLIPLDCTMSVCPYSTPVNHFLYICLQFLVCVTYACFLLLISCTMNAVLPAWRQPSKLLFWVSLSEGMFAVSKKFSHFYFKIPTVVVTEV